MAVVKSEGEVRRQADIRLGMERTKFYDELEGIDEPAYWFAEEMLRQIAEHASDERGLAAGVAGQQGGEWPEPIGRVDWVMRVGFAERNDLNRDWLSRNLITGLTRTLERNPAYQVVYFPSTPVVDTRQAVDREPLPKHTRDVPVTQIRRTVRTVDFTNNSNPCIVVLFDLGERIGERRGLISVAGPRERLFDDMVNGLRRRGEEVAVLYRPTGR